MGNVAAQAAAALPLTGGGGGPETNNTDADFNVSDMGNIEVSDISVPISINVGSNNNEDSNNVEDSVINNNSNNVEDSHNTEDSNNVEDSNNTENSNNVENSNNTENSNNVAVGVPIKDDCPQFDKKRWAWFNCGVNEPNCKNVFLSSEHETFEAKRDIDIAGEKEVWRWWGRSHVWSKNSINYTVNVKRPAKYDVTLIFAENVEDNFGVGCRTFDVKVSPDDKEGQSVEELDVFAKVGPKQYYALTFWNVKVKNDIKIVLSKGSAENPMISGIFVHGPKK